ncbi:MAG: hypothetical protein R3A10_07585 [Caldilineaceae bacterium]
MLRYVAQAGQRHRRHLHHPQPALCAVGDRFTILKRGRTFGTFTKDELSREEMVRMMSGADELDALTSWRSSPTAMT